MVQGHLIVAAIAVDDEAPWQPSLAEHLLGYTRRPGLTEEEKAEPWSGEQPGIAMAAIGPPAGLVGVFDRGLAVFLDQPVRNAGKHTGHAVADLHLFVSRIPVESLQWRAGGFHRPCAQVHPTYRADRKNSR
jgi:hypothetical protein